MYYRARFYDTELGRFLTKDPLTGGPDDPRVCYASNIYGMHKAEIDRNTSVLNAKLFDIRREIEREKLSQNIKQKENEGYSDYVQRVILASLKKEIELQRKYSGKTIGYIRNKQQLEWGLDPFNTNRYVYCLNNPINYIDPLGLKSIFIKYENGIKIKIKKPTIKKLLAELNKAARSKKNKIKELSIKGHGASGLIQLNKKEFLTVGTGKGGEKIIIDQDGNNLTDTFNKALTSKATISLDGCKTGRGKTSIAQGFSKALPGRKVRGGSSFLFDIPFNTGKAFGTKNVYQNGRKVDKDWYSL